MPRSVASLGRCGDSAANRIKTRRKDPIVATRSPRARACVRTYCVVLSGPRLGVTLVSSHAHDAGITVSQQITRASLRASRYLVRAHNPHTNTYIRTTRERRCATRRDDDRPTGERRVGSPRETRLTCVGRFSVSTRRKNLDERNIFLV